MSSSYAPVPGCRWAATSSETQHSLTELERSVAISGNGMRVAVGSPQHSPGGCTGTGCNRGAGRVSVYEWVTGYWSQIGGHLVGDRCETNDPDDECIWYSDNLGYSVSLSYDGKYLAVGAFTYVMVYEWKHGFIWEPHYASSGDEVKYLDAGTGRYYGRVRISGDGNRLAIAAGNWRRADGGSAQTTPARLRVFERVYNPSGSDSWVKIGGDLPSVNAGCNGGRSPSTSISQDGSIVSFSGGGENFCWLKVFQYNEDSSSWEQMGSTFTVDMTDFFCGTTLGDLSNDGLSIAVRHIGTVRWQMLNIHRRLSTCEGGIRRARLGHLWTARVSWSQCIIQNLDLMCHWPATSPAWPWAFRMPTLPSKIMARCKYSTTALRRPRLHLLPRAHRTRAHRTPSRLRAPPPEIPAPPAVPSRRSASTRSTRSHPAARSR